ncbi:MAG: glycosyltransferase [Ruminococcaceae bacterium]|nr:glycosyltransferase [Oscillospiraceae bacterium]
MKYSVIIPVYNAAQTLPRCLDSLAQQSYPDAELLLIDDGSTDDSGAICRAYAARDPRIVLLHKENGGVSTARNLGLDRARGEYVLFVDSDDHVEPGYFDRLDALDPDGLYDYLLFSYRRSDGTCFRLKPFASLDPAEYGARLARAYYRKWINVPWNKRYRRSILQEHHLRFHPELTIAEDALFNLQYLLHCGGLCLSGELLYTVSLENTGSLSRRPLDNRREQLALASRESDKAIDAASIGEPLLEQLTRARNFLLLSDIYSEGKQLRLTGAPRKQRWRILTHRCRSFNRLGLPLPGDLRCRLLALPVKLCAAPILDLAARILAGR